MTVFFSYGFRPFFFGAALFAGVAVPAWIFLPVWFFLQISMGLKQQGSNVAFWAHVGGFLAGAIISIAVYNYIPKARPYPSRTDHRD